MNTHITSIPSVASIAAGRLVAKLTQLKEDINSLGAARAFVGESPIMRVSASNVARQDLPRDATDVMDFNVAMDTIREKCRELDDFAASLKNFQSHE